MTVDVFPSVHISIRNTPHHLVVPNVLAVDFEGPFAGMYPSYLDPWHLVADGFHIRPATNPPSTAVIITVKSSP